MNLNLAAWDFIKEHKTDIAKDANVTELAQDLEKLLHDVRKITLHTEREATADTIRRVERCVSRVFEWARRRRAAH